MIDQYYSILGSIFGPILVLPDPLALAIMSILVTFVVTLIYKKFIDQTAMREIKAKVKAMQAESKELQKTDPDAASKKMSEMMSLTNQQMKLSMKPMIPTMIFVLAFLPWISSLFEGPVVFLPFELPFFGNDFGWLAWYMMISLPSSQLLRKILGVEI
ncbi:MAG: DUF106 domain-containing protein [Candidatus Aenigmarchaeota archaeon]|nr:DUF106 domain-containing protein [Candidatus Aenigmarchaeota archaeon]